jgi:hypothetical protein
VRNDIAAAGSDVIVASVCSGGRLRTHVVTAEGNVTTTMIDPWFPEKGVRIAAAPAGNGTTLLVWTADDALHSAVLSPDGVTAPRKLADKGTIPLLLTKTPNGFARLTTYGRFSMATLDEDGSLRVVHDNPANAMAAPTARRRTARTFSSRASRRTSALRAWLFTSDARLAASTSFDHTGACRSFAPAIGAGSESLVAADRVVAIGDDHCPNRTYRADGTILSVPLSSIGTRASD